MTSSRIAPYGSWRSPVSAEDFAAAEIIPQQLHLAGESIHWVEIRPEEGGRYAVVRKGPHGLDEVLTPPGYNVRTRVHEYGGGSYCVARLSHFFSNFDDQRLYRQDPGGQPVPITPAPDAPCGLRYADARPSPSGRWIAAVHERHSPGGLPENLLVALDPKGGTPIELAAGHDFFAAPRFSPDGRRLAWLTWDFPQMPWDGTELWVGEFLDDARLGDIRKVAGGSQEAIFQPEWSAQGELYFLSDRTGWSNLYVERRGMVEPVTSLQADLGYPMWQFGYSRYAFLSRGRVALVYSHEGFDHLGVFDPQAGRLEPVDTGYLCFYPPHLVSDGEDRVWFTAGAPDRPLSVVCRSISAGTQGVLRASPVPAIAPAHFSIAQPIRFPSEGGETAHALFYPPTNPEFEGPPHHKPPLIVFVHGGPTSSARPYLDLEIQYFTSRGLAVADLNYGGSTRYGRAYQERLRGQWGIVDLADSLACAGYLAGEGRVDPARMAIRGGSAGGYTTLRALTSSDLFAAGASYYGIPDLESFDADTHKFESRYSEYLIGPYPRERERYRERSPIHHLAKITSPVILFQGLEDRIVPPSQAEMIVRALEERRLPYAYLAFEGEQHGFRRFETNRRCLEAEFYFYSRVFGFDPAEPIEPVPLRFFD